MIEDMYKENILEHYKEPRNFGKLAKYSNYAREVNPLCGDNLEISLDVEDGIVKDVKFNGQGCAISQASCSMLTENIKGKKIEDIKRITTQNVINNLGIEISPVRMKCALLSLKVLNSAIKSEKNID